MRFERVCVRPGEVCENEAALTSAKWFFHQVLEVLSVDAGHRHIDDVPLAERTPIAGLPKVNVDIQRD